MIRPELVDLVKKFEGFRANTYRDVAGVLTIGYGSTGQGIKDGDVWTEQEAEDRLIADLEAANRGIQACTQTSLSDDQLDALTDFVYNLGIGAYQRSTLKKYIEIQEFDKAADQFLRWDNAAGRVNPDLLQRRTIERSIFLNGYPNT